MSNATVPPDAPFDFDCPRCGTSVAQDFYGPCRDCREQLRSEMGGDQRDVQEIEHEPKMNVVPNHVATKD